MSVFERTKLAGIPLSNRFVRSATGEGLATGEGFCSRALTRMMVDLAKGGVGLIITGHTAVRADGRVGRRQLGLWHDGHLPALSDMTGRVHEAAGKIVMQLSHAGLFSHPAVTGEAPLGPMQKALEGGVICKEMTRRDIRDITQSFARAACLARLAGFDGVEIHAAHGYLLSAFLSPHFNQRRDEYGGTVENRARFLLEVVTAVFDEAGRDFPVFVKINTNDYLPNGLTVNDMLQSASLLQQAGVAAIELSGGTVQSGKMIPARPGKLAPEAEGYYREEARYFKQTIGLPLILVGGFRSLEVAEQVVADGLCDYVALSRPLIREPDLILRWMRNDRAPAFCISDNLCYRPLMAGKGLYCLSQIQEVEKIKARTEALFDRSGD